MKPKYINLILILIICCNFILNSQPANFIPKGIGGGGALFFPTINPANDNEFYTSCDMSQLFHSTDFGNSYSQIHFSKLQVQNTSTYEFTNNTQIAYCVHSDQSYGYPVKTTDGGDSWNQIISYDVDNYGAIYKLKANYNNPNQIIIGAYADILISNNGGSSFSLVKHTANNGSGIIFGGVFYDENNIYIGTNEGLLYSNDNGINFELMKTNGINSDEVIWNFSAARAGDNTRFLCITASPNDVYNGVMPWDYNSFAKGVYIMNNANGNWESKSEDIDFSSDFVMYTAMATNDINVMYLAGSDSEIDGPLVFKSIDAGNSWSKVYRKNNNENIITAWEGAGGDKAYSWSETCFGITVAPNNSNKVIFGNFSNIQVSSDGAQTWKQAYVSNSDQNATQIPTPKNKSYHSIGLENTTCHQITWQSPNKMMACFSDIGGIRSLDSGNTWGFNYKGFSVNSLYRIEAVGEKIFGACSNIHDMYQSTHLKDANIDANDANGKIVYSLDSGATWENIHVFNHPVYWIEADPNNANRMYASVIHFGGTQGSQLGGIYKTDNLNNLSSSIWTKLPNPPRTEGHPACLKVLNDGNLICTYSGRRNSSGTFTASSGVFIYNNVSNTWTDLSHAGMHYWTNDIVIDPNDPSENTWFVSVFSGWGGAPNGLGGLYKTTNRGINWTKLTASQFDRVTSITFNPNNNNQAFLTTETQGLWQSNDMSSNIPAWSLVESYPFRQPERVFFNPYNQNEMWVSSFGNGMKVGLMNQTTGIVSFYSNNQIKIFPNPSTGVVNLEFDDDIESQKLIEIYNMQGQKIITRNVFEKVNRLDLGVLPNNTYIVKVIYENGSVKFGKFIKK
ncbi:MAG: T9SS type A sorting domain-containing protein [Candidatus Kapaibacterium sp.]